MRVGSIANLRASALRAASGTNNNSKLVDDNTAQQLRHEEIEKMKADGRGGRAIVDAVVKNSITYAEKTEYAKEKYVRKKQKKCVCHNRRPRSDRIVSVLAKSVAFDMCDTGT
eukprot:COSAG02_NODE_93_length_37477_cov_78.101129_22_plen_113_part_00